MVKNKSETMQNKKVQQENHKNNIINTTTSMTNGLTQIKKQTLKFHFII